LILALLGCASAPTAHPAPWQCDPRAMAAGEVRVREVPCTDELLENGDALRGDFVLENAVARFFVRASGTSLTQLARAGGTIVDAAPPTGIDTLEEAIPELEQGWFTSVDSFVPEHDALTVEGRFANGTAGSVTYRLAPDSPVLELGAPSALVVPLAGASVVGATIEREDGADAVVGARALLEDLGGWVRVEGPFAVGTRDVVTAARFPDVVAAAGKSNGTWVVAELAGETALRLPVIEGAYAGLVPSGSLLHAEAAGRVDSAAVPAESAGELLVGAAGALAMSVTRSDGTPIPALVRLDDGRVLTALPGGADLLTGPYTGTIEVYLGPAYERVFLDATIEGLTALSVVADPVVGDAILCDFGTLGWPDPSVREDPAIRLARLAGAHVGFAVLQARDEVARVSLSNLTSAWLLAESGSRTTGPQGTLVAWPFSANAKLNAHSAVEWTDLDAADLEALLDRSQTRSVLVDATWVGEMTGLPRLWDPWPFGFRFDGLADVDAYAAPLDGWLALGAMGPLAWVDGVVDRNVAEVERALLEGRSTATNGPRIVLTVNGGSPGDLVPAKAAVDFTLTVEAPSWIPLTEASLVGSDGTIATFDLAVDRTFAGTIDPPPAWVIATVSGDPAPPWITESAFAVTSPVWLAEP
jgi:hypothetical protein